MATPFDFLNSVNYTKEWIFDGEDSERDYVPFIVNRTLSYAPDALLWANEVNKADIPKEWQYALLFHALTKRKRYAKWEKRPGLSEEVELISEAYQCSLVKAADILRILTEEQVAEIRSALRRPSCKSVG